jgi:hypothetical protein
METIEKAKEIQEFFFFFFKQVKQVESSDP